MLVVVFEFCALQSISWSPTALASSLAKYSILNPSCYLAGSNQSTDCANCRNWERVALSNRSTATRSAPAPTTSYFGHVTFQKVEIAISYCCWVANHCLFSPAHFYYSILFRLKEKYINKKFEKSNRHKNEIGSCSIYWVLKQHIVWIYALPSAYPLKLTASK